MVRWAGLEGPVRGLQVGAGSRAVGDQAWEPGGCWQCHKHRHILRAGGEGSAGRECGEPLHRNLLPGAAPRHGPRSSRPSATGTRVLSIRSLAPNPTAWMWESRFCLFLAREPRP